MKCTKCGYEMSENSVFCSMCGTRAVKEEAKPEMKMVCTSCGKEFDAEMMYCDECGSKLRPSDDGERKKMMENIGNTLSNHVGNAAQRTTVNTNTRDTGLASGNTLLFTSKMMNLYEGDTGFKATKATGYVKVYPNHIEFEVKMGSSLGAIVGILGMMAAKKQAEDLNMRISCSSITGVYEKTCMGVKGVTIDLADGRRYTFSPYLLSSAASQDLMAAIKRQLLK